MRTVSGPEEQPEHNRSLRGAGRPFIRREPPPDGDWDELVAESIAEEFLGLERIPGVCGGEPCIVGTQIPVWVLEQARRLGTSEADLLRAYPMLHADDLANVWAYVRSHREEIDEQIRAEEET
jgi:uncharacterized protein (DUF433 family)